MTATTKGTKMRQRRKAVHVPRSCCRCHQRLSSRTLRESWVVLRDGFIQSTVCLSCTTPSEMADLLLLEVGAECGLNSDGRILVRNKFRTPTG
jgi:hypothetical protein